MTNRSRLAAKVTVVATAASADHRPGQRRAHRHGRASPSRLQGHAHAGRGAGREDGRLQCPRHERWAAGLDDVGGALHAGRHGGQTPGGQGGAEKEDDDDGEGAGAEDGQVDLHALVQLGPPGRPDREQRRQRDRDRDRRARRAAPATIAVRPSASPTNCVHVRPQGAQDRNLGCVLAELAGERLTEDEEPGQTGEGGEHQESDGLGADRPPDPPVAVPVVGEEDVAADLLGPLARQALGGSSERGHVGAVPQPDGGAVEVQRVALGVLPVGRRSHEDLLLGVELGRGHHLPGRDGPPRRRSP